MKRKHAIGLSLIALTLAAAIAPGSIKASDHDDGEVELKGRNLNLTDLYVFRDKDQNSAANDDDLVLIMNTNPRSLARQQYFLAPKRAMNSRFLALGMLICPLLAKKMWF